MRKFISVLIFLIVVSMSSSAQVDDDLELPYQLYFNYFSGGAENKLYFIQENAVPVEVYSTQHSILDFSWSPNGDKIIIIRNERGFRGVIAEIYADDFQLIYQFEMSLYEYFPMTWSSDGETLFWIGTSDIGLAQILSISINTLDNDISVSNIPLLESEEISQIYWSPDTNYLLYQTISHSDPSTATPSNNMRQPDVYKLFMLNIETHESMLVTDTSYRSCIAWSKDSQFFALISSQFQDSDFPFPTESNLHIYDLGLEQTASIKLEPNSQSSLGCPMTWSNNGQYIAFETTFKTVEHVFETGITIVDVMTEETRIVGISNLTSYDIQLIEWSPDDSWIAIGTLYNAFRDVRLFSYETDEEVIITLQGIPLFNPVWRDTSN